MRTFYLLLLFMLLSLDLSAQTFDERCIHNAFTTQYFAIQQRNDSILLIGEGNMVDSPFTQKISYSLYESNGAFISARLIVADTAAMYFSTNALGGGSFITMLDGQKATTGCNSYLQPFLAIFNNADSLTFYREYPATNGLFLAVASVFQLNDSSFMLTGSWQDSNYTVKGIIIKLDKYGNEIWRKYYGPPQSGEDESVSFITQSPGDTLYTFAYIQSDPNNINYVYSNKFCVYQMDTGGNVIKALIRADSVSTPKSIIQDGTGYIMASAKLKYIDTTYNANAPVFEGYIAKLDNKFNPQWHITIEDTSTSSFGCCKRLNDGNYLAAGSGLSSVFSPIVNTWPGCGLFVKFNEEGTVLWLRRFLDLDSIPDNDQVNDFTQLNDGSIVACGTANSILNNDSFPYQGWLLRLDTCGCLVPGCQNVGIKDIAENNFKLSVYPNPAANVVYILIKAGTPNMYLTFNIYNEAGKLLATQPGAATDITYLLHVNNYAAGVYFVQLVNAGQLVATERFIKR